MRIYLLILLSLAFMYGQSACIKDGASFENGGNLDFCQNGDTGCDCNNECGGSALLDDCNNCSGGNTGQVLNYAKDECGICGGPGKNVLCWNESLVCNADDCPFNPNNCLAGTTGTPDGTLYNNTCVPTDFSSVDQSTKQAFYFISSVTINGEQVEADDWVGAFKGNVCVGAKKWDTESCSSGVCSVPAMGFSSLEEATAAYMLAGDIPTFQIYDASENLYYNAIPSENIAWESAGIINISSLVVVRGCTNEEACNYNSDATIDNGSCLENDCAGECGGSAELDESGECSSMAIDELLIPDYSISNIYPNPFNPITSIEYSLPENASVELIVYNIHGRYIQTLIQSFQTAGYHSINWNAQNYPSGVYLIRLESSTYSQMQKVVLIK